MHRTIAWRGFASILCAVDFSEPAALALQYAGAVARRGCARLTALHVTDPLLAAAASTALHDPAFAERTERELRRFTDAYLSEDDSARFVRAERVVVGTPAEEILNAASVMAADLIVVGTAGLTGASRVILGSTTSSVLQRSTIPVLAVPPPEVAKPPDPRSWPAGPIVVALDVDDDTRGEIALAADIAAWLGAPMLIVHVAHANAAPAAARRDAEMMLAKMTADVRKDVPLRVHVVAGEIGREIAAVAQAQAAGLVVTMLRDRRGWFGAQRGSISYDVVTDAVTPVLAIPPEWRRRDATASI